MPGIANPEGVEEDVEENEKDATFAAEIMMLMRGN